MDRARFGNFVLYGLAVWGALSGALSLMLLGAFLAMMTFAMGSRSENMASAPAAADEKWEELTQDKEVGGLGLRGTGEGGGGFGSGPGLGGAAHMESAKGDVAKKSAVLQFLTTRGDASGGAAVDLLGEKAAEEPVAADEGGGERMRSWFPEAFLWRPLVATDATGVATVDVRVPDQLTSWRVLALAHTMAGAQAGAVHTFDSALPLYVDPVVPGWMYAGDTLDLPVQIVNTTHGSITAPLTVSADGALSGQASASITLPAGGTAVQRVSLSADGAGLSHVTAVLSGGDAVQREIPVIPRGRPVERIRGGTVGSTTAFAIAGPDGADPATEELEVRVYPGPLAVLQSEVARGGSGGTPWDASYGFALATRIGDLSQRAHVDVDAASVRKLRILAWQRVVQHARAPDPGSAADLLAGLRGTTDHEQAVELIGRLQRTLAEGQRSDGTWARANSGTLQQTIIATAFAARQLSADQTGPRLKARGAITRQMKQITDPYTAAVVLASGLVDGTDADNLRAIVTGAATDAGDGRMTVGSPGGVVNAWGWAPSRAEVLAWTILALPEGDAWRGDLVAELMSGYSGTWGFGAGPADVVALEAVATSLPGLDKPIDVVLTVDGREVSRAKLDPAQPKVPATLEAHGAVGEIGIAISPQVPGLAFVATRRSWIPWRGDERLPGVDVELSAGPMSAGEDATITLSLAAPSGTALVIEQGLPAGATVDEGALAAISDRIVEYTVKSDRVRLVTRPFQAGEEMVVPITVRPAFAGTFSTVPLSVEARGDAGQSAAIAPLVWTVGG